MLSSVSCSGHMALKPSKPKARGPKEDLSKVLPLENSRLGSQVPPYYHQAPLGALEKKSRSFTSPKPNSNNNNDN